MSRTFAMSMNQSDVEALLDAGKIEQLKLYKDMFCRVPAKFIIDNQGNEARLVDSTLTFDSDNNAWLILSTLRAAGCNTAYIGNI